MKEFQKQIDQQDINSLINYVKETHELSNYLECYALELFKSKEYSKTYILIRIIYKTYNEQNYKISKKDLKIYLDYTVKFLNFEGQYNKNKAEFKQKYESIDYKTSLYELIVERRLKAANKNKMKIINEMAILREMIEKPKVAQEQLIDQTCEQLERQYETLILKYLYAMEHRKYDDVIILFDGYNQSKFQKNSATLKDQSSQSDCFILGPACIFEFLDSKNSISPSLLWNYRFVFPLSQADSDGLMCFKSESYVINSYYVDNGNQDNVYSIFFIEKFPNKRWNLPNEILQPDGLLDVFYWENAFDDITHNLIKTQLDHIAINTDEYHSYFYQNLIDPNMCVSLNESNEYERTATEFIIQDKFATASKRSIITALQLYCKVNNKKRFGKFINWKIAQFLNPETQPQVKIASVINTLNPESNIELYILAEKILTHAMPMLSHICRPGILLPGRLQAVIKAQRVILAPNDEYRGVWHRDGKYEEIVAF